jgi:hypothetical protein
MAVEASERGRGLGAAILAAAEQSARDAGASLMRLHAQRYVEDLYAAARGCLDRHPAETADAILDQDAARADYAARLDRDHLDRVVVEPVLVRRERNSLLDAEDLLAQGQRLVDLVAIAGRTDFH